MIAMTRRRFAAAAVTAGVMAAGGRARAATILTLASNLPSGHPMLTRMQEAADAVTKDTDGAYRIRFFPNSALGGDLEVLNQLRAGAVQFYPLAGAQLSTMVPIASLNGVGFAFRDMKAVWAAMDGEVGALIRTALTKAGFHVLDRMYDNGFRQITSSTHPIARPGDLKGFTIRVPPSPLSTSLFKAFGASPQSISFGEVYTALQTHLVQGQENPLLLIETAKFYEVQKYVSMTNHMWDGFWFLINPGTWQRLPPAARDSIAKHFNAAALRERDDIARLNAGLVAKLKGAGMTIVEPDRDAFRAVLDKTGFYAEWKGRFGAKAWSALEKYTGTLG